MKIIIKKKTSSNPIEEKKHYTHAWSKIRPTIYNTIKTCKENEFHKKDTTKRKERNKARLFKIKIINAGRKKLQKKAKRPIIQDKKHSKVEDNNPIGNNINNIEINNNHINRESS